MIIKKHFHLQMDCADSKQVISCNFCKLPMPGNVVPILSHSTTGSLCFVNVVNTNEFFLDYWINARETPVIAFQMAQEMKYEENRTLQSTERPRWCVRGHSLVGRIHAAFLGGHGRRRRFQRGGGRALG